MVRKQTIKYKLDLTLETVFEKKNRTLITTEHLIKAYLLGIFPMSNGRNNNKIYFVDPDYRAIIPIQEFHVSKSLKRFLKKKPFKITINKAFPEVIRSCALVNRKETWINEEIEILFNHLHLLRYAHSIECWQDNKLVGGIYGVAIGGVFFAESMFSSISNGSKVALLNLVARLWKAGFKLLDVQFINEHLIQFGAYEITKKEFKKKLNEAISLDIDIYSLGTSDKDFFECLSTFLQDRTETS